MVQTVTNTFNNREQEKDTKAQEKEKRKEARHAQMLALLQGSPMANLESLNAKKTWWAEDKFYDSAKTQSVKCKMWESEWGKGPGFANRSMA